jgi:hypothetical protein
MAEINNFGHGAVFILCLVSELHKPSLPGLEHRTGFRGYGLRFRNLLFETNNSGHGVIFYPLNLYFSIPLAFINNTIFIIVNASH